MENFTIIFRGRFLLVWGSCSFENCLVSFVVAGFFCATKKLFLFASCIYSSKATFVVGWPTSDPKASSLSVCPFYRILIQNHVESTTCSWYIADYLFLFYIPTIFWCVFYLCKLKIQQRTHASPPWEVMAYNRDSGRYLVQLLPPSKGSGPGPIFQGGTEVPPISKLVLLQNLRPAVERTLKPPLKEANFI